MATARTIRCRWEGIEVALGMDEAGSGPSVVLLPALSSISTRAEMRPLFDRLATEFRVSTVDWPGFGDSARPRADWSPETLSAFLNWFLTEVVLPPHAVVAAGHAATYALFQAAHALGTIQRLVLIAPTWRGPLPTMMGGQRPWFARIRAAVDLPGLGPLLYRLNVSRPIVARMAREHVYGDPDWLSDERLAAKLAITRAPGARHASVRFVTGAFDRVGSRVDFLDLARRVNVPILMVYGDQTPPRSLAEMDARRSCRGNNAVPKRKLFERSLMVTRPLIVAMAFAAGAAMAAFTPGISTTLQRAVSIGIGQAVPISSKPEVQAPKTPMIAMDEARIKLAQIDQAGVGPATIAKRLVVPGTIVPDAGRVAHVSVKLSGTVAELRKNIGDDVVKDEVIAVLESREVADAKSEYLAAQLTDELQRELFTRDKMLWDSRVSTEQQFLKSRTTTAQTGMRLNIARQKLLALGLQDSEIASLPQAPEALLRRQDVRAPISGRLVERKVDLGTAVGRDNLETELFVIVDLSRVWLELSVASSDLPLMKEGQAVKIAAKGLPKTATGQIMFVSPLLDKDTRTARVIATIDNGDGSWRPGSFVTAAVALNEKNAAVVVPTTAIQNVGGEQVVFVRTKDGFEKRGVVLGQREDQSVEITSGLTAGETIAVSNTFSLKAELSKPRDED